ncbi:MAG: tyrosine-type recombinase/integrase [Candidatus Hodarchaeota archaeon]
MHTNIRIQQRYLNELDQNYQAGLAKYSTVLQRQKALNQFIQFLNTNQLKLKQLTTRQVQAFLQYLASRKTSRGTSLAPDTLKQIYSLVKGFYVWCYEQRFVKEHPDLIFTKNLLRQYKLGERKLPKYISQDQMQKLLAECPKRWQALLNFMYDTGARLSEVLRIQLKHLDLEKQMVRIFEPKTMNVRMTNLSDKTIGLLREYLVKYRPSPKDGHEKIVFINQQHRQMKPRAVQRVIKRISERILGQNHKITPHYFRAACAVHLLERGGDIREVQEIIGWKSLAVVQNYTRVTLQRQIQLKKEYHPSFRTNTREVDDLSSPSSIDSKDSEILSSLKEIKRSQEQNLKRIAELEQALQQERKERQALIETIQMLAQRK